MCHCLNNIYIYFDSDFLFAELDSLGIRHTFNGKPDRRFYLTGGGEKSYE